MMDFIWLFFVASFAGWVLETITSAIKQKRFINRGLVNAPFCILYGSALVFITIFCDELYGFWLFLGSTLVATLFEWTAGHLIEKIYSEKWWDYSNRKWNLDGYVCLSTSLMWGALAFFMVKWGNSFVIKVFHLLPALIGKWLVIVLSVALILDVFATFIVISHKNADESFWHEVDKFFDKLTLGISTVWGLGIALATMLLYKYRDKSDKFLFAAGSLLGGLYEYVCSVFTEIAFGKVFWEYSHMPFNLGGRINLLYCFFWGIAAVVWMKYLYPKFSNWIEKLPVKIGKNITCILVIFMCVNMAVSSLALIRSTQREHGIEAEKVWQQVMDERFSDERLAKIYPNMIQVN